jgi:hypothetical protein
MTVPAWPGRTGRGQIALQPDGLYMPAPRVSRDSGDQVTVEFCGEDGRSRVFRFAGLPCPGLHADLACAFEARVGPAGTRRTLASAVSLWGALGRFLAFLGTLRVPPPSVSALRPRHLDRFRLRRLETAAHRDTAADMAAVSGLLAAQVLDGRLHPGLADYAAQRPQRRRHAAGGVPGYSDREYTAIMTAARSDAAAIRGRIRLAERLLARYETSPGSVGPAEREHAAALARIASSGQVPALKRARSLPDSAAMIKVAGQLFLTGADLAPLLILAAGLTGRNAETLKELPAGHRVLDGRAVAVGLVKRRRGKTRSRETVHWETGSSTQQLRTPGGFYLLLHDLTARSRGFSSSEHLWSIWVSRAASEDGHGGPGAGSRGGHIDPFARRLGRVLDLAGWAARHQLTADGDAGDPLRVTLNRIKTTVEVRTARTFGGHLPSASRTNTADVSFLHYLRNDPRIRDWADSILTDAIEDAERNARAFHLRILATPGRGAPDADPRAAAAALGTTPEKIRNAGTGALDTLVSSCLDIEHSPFSGGGPCQVSFLTCLRCPNALITERHLPMLLALADFLQDELGRSAVGDWCAAYGVTWLILTRLVLPRFTPAQREAAAARKPPSPPFALLDGPREHQ